MNQDATILTGMAGRIVVSRKRLGLRANEIARRVGVTKGAVSQWEKGDSAPNGDNLRKLARVLGVTVEWLSTGRGTAEIAPQTTSLDVMAEGERIDPHNLGGELAKPIQAAIGGRNAEVWRLVADKMMGAGYRPGDYLVVDLQAPAKPRDIVLAEINGIPIFRLYLPPYLFATPIGPPESHIVADQVRVMIRGVVVSRFSFS